MFQLRILSSIIRSCRLSDNRRGADHRSINRSGRTPIGRPISDCHLSLHPTYLQLLFMFTIFIDVFNLRTSSTNLVLNTKQQTFLTILQ